MVCQLWPSWLRPRGLQRAWPPPWAVVEPLLNWNRMHNLKNKSTTWLQRVRLELFWTVSHKQMTSKPHFERNARQRSLWTTCKLLKSPIITPISSSNLQTSKFEISKIIFLDRVFEKYNTKSLVCRMKIYNCTKSTSNLTISQLLIWISFVQKQYQLTFQPGSRKEIIIDKNWQCVSK